MFGSPNPDLPPGKVMLTHGLWIRRFGGDPSIVGRTVQMSGFGSEVVGVLPPEFRVYLLADAAMPTNIDAWGVLASNMSDFARDGAWLTVVTRLKDNVSLEQAQSEMDALAARLREVHQFHANQDMEILVNGMHRDVVSHARAPLLALMGAVTFVLLIACGNVANLLLANASRRGREIAVRAAVGGGHGELRKRLGFAPEGDSGGGERWWSSAASPCRWRAILRRVLRSNRRFGPSLSGEQGRLPNSPSGIPRGDGYQDDFGTTLPVFRQPG